MQKIFTSQSIVEAQLIKGILEENGIDTVMRNEFIAISAGATRTDAWPELWLLRDSDLPLAQELLAAPGGAVA